MMSRILKIALPVLVLGVGAIVLVLLVVTRPEAERSEPKKGAGMLVEVKRVRSAQHEVSVHAEGTTVPARQITLQPQVRGRVVWSNEDLEPGGRFDEGDKVLRIDRRDYRLAVESRQAEVSKARLELKLERSRKQIAEREWKMFAGDEEEEAARTRAGSADSTGSAQDAGGAGTALALRKPQVQTAQVRLQSAKSALDRAQLDLQRTVLRAPFNSLVLDDQVDEGQVVGPQTPVATLVGTDRFFVKVSVPVEHLTRIDVPKMGTSGEGASATIWQEVGAHRVERSGRVVRLLGNLDPQGAMARLLVAVEDPLGLQQEGKSTPMLLGTFVHVNIGVPPLDDVIEIPRTALREGDRVYVMNDQSRLEIRDVRIAWRRESSVLLADGVRDGERIVVSPIPTPADGLRLRVDDGNGKPKPVADAKASRATGGNASSADGEAQEKR